MAQSKRKPANRRTPSKRRTTIKQPFLTPRRKKEVLGLIVMVIALLLVLAIISYNVADDPLVRGRTILDTLLPGDRNEHNALGLLGAKLSYWLVPRFLGYFSILPALTVFLFGYVTFRDRPFNRVNWLAITAITASILFPIVVGIFQLALVGPAGLMPEWTGAVGGGIAHWIHRILGSVGALLFVFLLVGVLFLVFFDRDIQKSFDRIEELGRSIRSWLQLRWENFRIRRQEKLAERRVEKAAAPSQQTGPTAAHQSPPQRNMLENRRVTAQNEPIAQPSGVHVPGAFPPYQDISHDVEAYKQRHRTGAGSSNLNFDVRLADGEKEANLASRPIRVTKENVGYVVPPLDLLDSGEGEQVTIDRGEVEENKQILIDKLDTYNIEIIDGKVIVGPTVTLYELYPAPGVKVSKIKSLEDDLALAMAARGIRIIAPIPGKSAIGIEIPNRHRELVRIRGMLSTEKFQTSTMELPIALGKTIENKVYLEDLTKMPHLLIAGSTGSGKSVGVNAMIAGLLYAKHPADLKFVMIDPKKIELQQYNHVVNHFIAMTENSDSPIITDVAEALSVLKSCEREMELRYDLLSDASVRSIREYNNKLKIGKLDPDKGHRHLPYIVLVIDELADLMMTAGKEIEGPIARLAQMARAIGIHLILATQRPSVDVITGLIKANFPARAAFQVASKIDSRTILDGNGAERLVGNGDLLYMNGSRTTRLQGPFVSVEEIDRLTEFIALQEGTGPYILPEIEDESLDSGLSGAASSGKRDELFVDAARIIVRSQQGSVSLLQRKLSVGYTRAARIVDQLEDAGIVGPFEGSKARNVLIPDDAALDQFLAG